MSDTYACPECGSVLPDLGELYDAAKETIAQQARTISRLRNEQRKQPTTHPRYGDAMEVLELWRQLCSPRTKELNGPRLQGCLDRLDHGYGVEDLKRSVVGYGRFPFVQRGMRAMSGGARRVDARLIFSDAEHVDEGIALADRFEMQLPGRIADRSKLSQMGQQALLWARAGVPVFPIRPRDKRPACRNGLLDATVDQERITRAWLDHPDLKIGVRCGMPSQLVVLDVDGDDGFESLRGLERVHGPLPATYSVVTPSGGQHFYFRHPLTVEIRNTAGFPAPFLDVRGDGGYVLVPPSETTKPYEIDTELPPVPLPQWLLKALVGYQQRVVKHLHDYAQLIRDGANHGERNNDLLKLVGHLWGRVSFDEVLEISLAMNDARCKPPLEHKEVLGIVKSVERMRARQMELV
jgi:hypothetical protein